MNVLNPEYDPKLDDILELDNNELQGWPSLSFKKISAAKFVKADNPNLWVSIEM